MPVVKPLWHCILNPWSTILQTSPRAKVVFFNCKNDRARAEVHSVPKTASSPWRKTKQWRDWSHRSRQNVKLWHLEQITNNMDWNHPLLLGLPGMTHWSKISNQKPSCCEMRRRPANSWWRLCPALEPHRGDVQYNTPWSLVSSNRLLPPSWHFPYTTSRKVTKPHLSLCSLIPSTFIIKFLAQRWWDPPSCHECMYKLPPTFLYKFLEVAPWLRTCPSSTPLCSTRSGILSVHQVGFNVQSEHVDKRAKRYKCSVKGMMTECWRSSRSIFEPPL